VDEPVVIVVLAGVNVSEVSAEELTLAEVEPQIDPAHALIVADPVPVPNAFPRFVASFVTATVLFEVDQARDASVWTLLSLNVPVAVSCWLVPTGTNGFVGLTATSRAFRQPAVVHINYRSVADLRPICRLYWAKTAPPSPKV
jgi:hypothetical protein